MSELELELQRLTPERRARDADEVADLLRVLGDLRADEVAERVVADPGSDDPGSDVGARRQAEAWLAELAAARRAMRITVAGETRWAAVEDAARFRDALGVPPPPGLPAAFLEPVERPTVDLVARYARTHGPFIPADVTARLGLPARRRRPAGPAGR